MVLFPNLGLNLQLCLCGGLLVALAKPVDFLDIGQEFSCPDWKLGLKGEDFPVGKIFLIPDKPGRAAKL